MIRKFLAVLFVLFLVAVGGAVAWIVWGANASLFLDRYRTVETDSQRISSVRYEGNGTGGILRVNDTALSLHPSGSLSAPTVGSTKDGQLGLAAGGKVFPFGPLPKSAEDSSDMMAATVAAEDDAQLSFRHSFLAWPTPLDFNFMTGAAPSWKRHAYQRLTWKKPNGAKLEMLWRYQQDCIGENGWTSPTMTHDDEQTGLITIDITP